MKKQNSKPEDAASIRQKAEEKLKLHKDVASNVSTEADKLKLIKELQVHQIELEMQNEELVAANEKAEIAEEKYTSLFDFAPTAYFNLTPDGDISELNLAGAKMLGEERKKLINSRLSLFISSNTRAVFDDLLSKALIDKKFASCEVIFVNGGDVPIYAYLSSIVADDGKHCLITAVDITESKRAENKLKKITYEYQTVFEGTQDALFLVEVLDKNTFRFVRNNRSHQKITGISLEEIKGKTPCDLVGEESGQKISANYSRCIREREPISYEETIAFPSGEKIWHTTLTPLFQDHVVYIIGSSIDITERKKAEEEVKLKNRELEKINAEKDKFFSIITHDLKSPFNSIIGLSEMLVEQINEKNFDGIEKYAGTILNSSQRAMDLLMNLMEWSRSQTGRIKFNPERFDLTEFINDITPLFDDIAGQKEIVIKKELPPEATVFADQDMINTVLRNLISNAIKFTKTDGEIILAVTKDKNKFLVSVKDTGIGMSKDQIEKLFRIEESESTSGTANEKGTGLGLILCKEFIENHDEKIWVESDPDGKSGDNLPAGKAGGSTFYFTLPFRTETEI